MAQTILNFTVESTNGKLTRFLEADYRCLVTLYDYDLIHNDIMKNILYNQNIYGAKK
jgi:hypothetical protein